MTTIHNIEPGRPMADEAAVLIPMQEREVRSAELVPPYGDGGPMDNSGFGGALAVAFIGFVALVGVLAMNVRHETHQASRNPSQSAAVQQDTAPPMPAAPAKTQ